MVEASLRLASLKSFKGKTTATPLKSRASVRKEFPSAVATSAIVASMYPDPTGQEPIKDRLVAVPTGDLASKNPERDQRNAGLAELVMEKLLSRGGELLTREDLVSRSGIPERDLERLWRALGFPDIDAGVPFFTSLDLEALSILGRLMESGVVDLEGAVQMARVIGSSMARIAEAEVSLATEAMTIALGEGGQETNATPAGTAEPTQEASTHTVQTVSSSAVEKEGLDVEAAYQIAATIETTTQDIARILEYVWRRHLEASVRRAISLGGLTLMDPGDLQAELAIGFADMVGFTAVSQQISTRELARLVSRFEAVANDVVAASGGRVVKMIGDEVMFDAPDPSSAIEIALNLADAYNDDELLTDVRIGLAWGNVLMHEADRFGPVVNLASRIVNLANPGSVLVSEELHEKVSPHGSPSNNSDLIWRPLRPRLLKDIGRVRLWAVMRAGTEERVSARRLGERWQRLSDAVARDLEELRFRGERFMQEREAFRRP
jgi:adenylate cyclase